MEHHYHSSGDIVHRRMLVEQQLIMLSLTILLVTGVGVALGGDLPMKSELQARDIAACQPLNFKPSQDWAGIDGNWSLFDVRVGTPEEIARVLISTAGQETWVIDTTACNQSDSSTCATDRGSLTNLNKSSSWQGKRPYALDLEQKLGYYGNGYYGLDTVGLGDNSSDGPSLNNQTVAKVRVKDWYIGLFGIGPRPVNFTDEMDSHPSFFATLKDKEIIPSLSWSYTAGAHYQSEGTPGSLVLGGFDRSRFQPNNMSFILAPDTSRDLVVGLQSIHTNISGAILPLWSNGIFASIDSTAPHIWLPQDACDSFAHTFQLTWDDTYEVYLVNDTAHDKLLKKNPSITFQLGTNDKGGSTIDILLPYAAFDVMARAPFYPNETRYFPLKRADNDTQYTLGRTFLQEAYLTADYERLNFSISQCVFSNSASPNIVQIDSIQAMSAPSTSSKKPRMMSTGAVVGISIAALLVVVSLVSIVVVTKLRKRAPIPPQEGDMPTTAQKSGSTLYEQEAQEQLDPLGTSVTQVVEIPSSLVAELEGHQPPQKAQLKCSSVNS